MTKITLPEPSNLRKRALVQANKLMGQVGSEMHIIMYGPEVLMRQSAALLRELAAALPK